MRCTGTPHSLVRKYAPTAGPAARGLVIGELLGVGRG